ncbi:hypothetical protein BH11MYX1_BH11MYX1_20400 [soil metagenome]
MRRPITPRSRTLRTGTLRIATMLACASALAHGEPAPVALRAHATKLEGGVTIDGHLDDPCWKTAVRLGHFTQRFPKDGGTPDLQTEFAVVYDDDAIYVGVWADDPEPSKIRAQLTRRDVDALADTIVVGFDSYHDRRTAYSFQLNAAGVQRDMLMYDDHSQDDTWDAVWTGNAAIDAHGWTAEFRIPLNQLRYADDNKEWGMQIVRFVGRTTEQSAWSPWPRSSPQVVSRYGILEGLDKIPQARRLELLPYITGGLEVQPVRAGDPINDRYAARHGIGLDLKYGLGPAFTLSATINPDFGQVEADPSQVNLGPQELFYAEKRPFFLEGVDLFKLPMGNNDSGAEGLFYSRRIGATPDDPDMALQFIRQPAAQAIYGAVKLTGKTRDGWSLGLFDAVTGQEQTTVIDANGDHAEPIVAALTNYAVGRVKRDLREGKTSIGLAATAVDRSLDGTPLRDVLHDQAYTGGAQLDHRWDDNAWEAKLATTTSWVHGSQAAIARTQQLNTHLFQRPDLVDDHFDPRRTSLSGFGATWKVGRYGDTKHWRFGLGGDLRTPGLELNNIGFQQSADQLVPFLFGQYREDEPRGDILNYNLNADIFAITNFDPIVENYGYESNGSIQFKNYWSVGGGLNVYGGGLDPVALRGGPALRFDHGGNSFLSISSDNRERLQVSVAGSVNRDWTADVMAGSLDATATIQARSNLDLTVSADWTRRDDPMQYVAQATDAAGAEHYITGHIKFTSTSLTMRVNWTFSPHLSLQAYAQPFIASGEYARFKDVDHPHAGRFRDRFHALDASELHATDDTVFASYNGSYSFGKPDFNFQQLRSTIVLRWEYRPGSNIFAIWNHGQTNQLSDGRFSLASNLSDLARAASDNTVMVKLNYWIGL